MPFEITPEPYVPPGTPVEPQNSTSFAVAPAPAQKQRDPDSFIQWQSGGYDLGDDKVLVVNFVYPFLATRGVGEHENVITVRRIVPPPPPPPQSLFYTSIIYPLIVEDAMQVSAVSLLRGYTLQVDVDNSQVTVPALQAGTLAATISFVTYNNSLLFPDNSQVTVPAILGATLVVTISYLTYDARPFPDQSQVPVPAIVASTLVVTITFISYVNALTYPDNSQIPVPSLRSGTLV